MNNSSHESDSDDSAPESISFGTSKQETNEQKQKVKEQINKIRESQKQKRVERQEKYIEQKKKKFEDIKLPEDLLEEVANESADKTKIKDKNVSKKLENAPKSKKIFDDIDLEKDVFTDFIPLKTYSNYGISVVNLKDTNKKPLIASERAKQFKNIMYNRHGIRRETAQESLASALKRKLVKISK